MHDARPKDTIRDAFEAMLAFLTILIGGPMPRSWPDIATAAAKGLGSQARTTEEAERAVAAIAALRDLIQRAAEEHSRPQIEPAAAADTWPPTRIAEALERCERATPGPWLSEAGWNNAGMPSRTWKVPGRNDGLEIEMLAGDALFVEHARTDLPSALRALGASINDATMMRNTIEAQAVEIERLCGQAIDLNSERNTYERAAQRLAADMLETDKQLQEARAEVAALAAKVETMIGVTAEAKPLDPSDKAAIAASWERAKQAPACTGPNKRGAS